MKITPQAGRPSKASVAGAILPRDPGVVFGRHKRVSPYDEILAELAKPERAGDMAQFSDMRARAGIASRAKKLGMLVLFGERAGALCVAFECWRTDTPQWKAAAVAAIRARLADEPENSATPMSIAIAIRASHPGLKEIDAGLVDAMLKQMPDVVYNRAEGRFKLKRAT